MDHAGDYSDTLKTFLWNGLAPNTRQTYNTAIKSYETFCKTHGKEPFPAGRDTLGEWVAIRAIGSPQQPAIRCDTIESYLSAIRAWHIDFGQEEDIFESSWLRRLVAGIRRTEVPKQSKQATPISLKTLEKVTKLYDSSTTDDITFTAATTVAFAGFLRIGEITTSRKDTRIPVESLRKLKPTRRDVTFATDGTHAILRLKRSKADKEHRGVDIVLPATGSTTCPVTALRTLFRRDPQDLDSFLFTHNGRSITREWLINTMRTKMDQAGMSTDFNGHSFRRGAAQHASDNGLGDDDIKTLGRWTSEAFKRYFTADLHQRYLLTRRFLLKDTSFLPHLGTVLTVRQQN
jgi:integrase